MADFLPLYNVLFEVIGIIIIFGILAAIANWAKEQIDKLQSRLGWYGVENNYTKH